MAKILAVFKEDGHATNENKLRTRYVPIVKFELSTTLRMTLDYIGELSFYSRHGIQKPRVLDVGCGAVSNAN